MGALIGLELTAEHSALVRLLIAHEPPVYRLLEGAEQDEALRTHTELLETFRRDGLPAAMKLMIARSGIDINDREPEVPMPLVPPVDPKSAAQRVADLQHFLTWDAPAVARYQPNIAALKNARSKIMPAIGSSSPCTFPYRSTGRLSGILGRKPVEFPGGHTGYVLRPKAFAAKLDELLAREG